MADIRPFAAIRPKKGLEAHIAALPYDVYNREEACEEVKREPLSFLRIDRAETQFGEEVDIYADCVYEKAAALLWDMVKKGQLIREEKPCYYIYELTMNNRSQTGIVACASVEDYEKGRIKKHENTRADKEKDRIRHVDVCNAQTGPIFLAYRSCLAIEEAVRAEKEKEPLYDFLSPDGIRHRVWRVDKEEVVAGLKKAFDGVDSIYIADGHHRCASAVKVSKMRKAQAESNTGKEGYHHFLSVLFPDRELMIMDYNRVVKDLNGYTPEAFLEAVSRRFFITNLGKKERKPEKKGEISMYLEDTWYLLETRDRKEALNPVEGLDVSLLQRELLAPILGIENPKTDNRIDFVGGIRGLQELERRVKKDCKVAFALYPTAIEELFAVSDAGLLMPPKSTWFEPKLRSGLFIHEL